MGSEILEGLSKTSTLERKAARCVRFVRTALSSDRTHMDAIKYCGPALSLTSRLPGKPRKLAFLGLRGTLIRDGYRVIAKCIDV